MKKILIILILIFCLYYNTKAEIKNKDFYNMEMYDVFTINTNAKVNSKTILKYFNDDEIISLIPSLNKFIKTKDNVVYNGKIEDINKYYVEILGKQNLLIDNTVYENIPINIDEIKIYTTYNKVYKLLTDYPMMTYNTNSNKKFRNL